MLPIRPIGHTPAMRGRVIGVVLASLAAACGGGGSDESVRPGTVAEFCATYGELEATYAESSEVGTVGELLDVLTAAIKDYKRLPAPPEIADDARRTLHAIEKAVDQLGSLDASIKLNEPTGDQRDKVQPVIETMQDAQGGAQHIREFAEGNCSKAGEQTTSTTQG